MYSILPGHYTTAAFIPLFWPFRVRNFNLSRLLKSSITFSATHLSCILKPPIFLNFSEHTIGRMFTKRYRAAGGLKKLVSLVVSLVAGATGDGFLLVRY